MDLSGSIIGKYMTDVMGNRYPATSMLAEYHGMLEAMKYIQRYQVSAERFVFVSDSEFMIDLLSRKEQYRHKIIFRRFANEILKYAGLLPKTSFKFVPREHNKIADQHVNTLLDQFERGTTLCH